MKHLITVILCLCMGFSANAQKIKESDLPAGVLKTYLGKAPDSLPARWEKINDQYAAHFVKNHLKAVVFISDKSEWVSTQWEIPFEYIPKKVKNYIHENYSGYKTVDSKIEYKPGTENYLMSVKKKKEKPVLRFSIKSEFMRIEPAMDNQKVIDKPAKDKG